MKIKKFDELSTTELYSIIFLREQVFVVEQKCYYQDADNNDQKSMHLMHYIGGSLAGYLRIIPPGITFKNASIGRVAVSKKHRGVNLGREIMEVAIGHLNELYPGQTIKIGAQQYLNKFYKSLGFENTGEGYLEDGIPHIDMLLHSK